jgi:hypothetical protein
LAASLFPSSSSLWCLFSSPSLSLLFFFFFPFLPLPCCFSSPAFLFLQRPPCPVCCSLWVQLVGGSSLKTLPSRFCCDRRRFVSPIHCLLLSFFTRPHRIELPMPLLRRHLACMGPTPFRQPFYQLWAPFLFFVPILLVPWLFFVYLVCVCFQVLRRQSSSRVFATHHPLLGLFPRPHRNELPTPLPFSVLGLCAIGICFFCFFIYLFI